MFTSLVGTIVNNDVSLVMSVSLVSGVYLISYLTCLFLTEYRSPFLYVIHQNAIEVVEICADSFTKSSADSDSDSDASPPVRMASRNMPRPLFIGKSYNWCNQYPVLAEHLCCVHGVERTIT